MSRNAFTLRDKVGRKPANILANILYQHFGQHVGTVCGGAFKKKTSSQHYEMFIHLFLTSNEEAFEKRKKKRSKTKMLVEMLANMLVTQRKPTNMPPTSNFGGNVDQHLLNI